jgi:hypothetical protein
MLAFLKFSTAGAVFSIGVATALGAVTPTSPNGGKPFETRVGAETKSVAAPERRSGRPQVRTETGGGKGNRLDRSPCIAPVDGTLLRSCRIHAFPEPPARAYALALRQGSDITVLQRTPSSPRE